MHLITNLLLSEKNLNPEIWLQPTHTFSRPGKFGESGIFDKGLGNSGNFMVTVNS